MALRSAMMFCVLATGASSAVAQIHNTTTTAWQVQYSRNDNIPGHTPTDRRDLVLRIQILPTTGGGPRDYQVNIRRFNRIQSNQYRLRANGGSFDNVPVNEDVHGSGGNRKRMYLQTEPQPYVDEDGNMQTVKVTMIWHTGKTKGSGSRTDDRLNVRVIDTGNRTVMTKAGLPYTCPEEPDTDVLDETPVDEDLDQGPPVDE